MPWLTPAKISCQKRWNSKTSYARTAHCGAGAAWKRSSRIMGQSLFDFLFELIPPLRFHKHLSISLWRTKHHIVTQNSRNHDCAENLNATSKRLWFRFWVTWKVQLTWLLELSSLGDVDSNIYFYDASWM